MDSTAQRERAELFRSLHEGPGLLMLPNAWDVASALVLEAAGFPAVASTSAGIAATLGAPDGEHLDIDDHLDMIVRMAAAVRVPLSADLEGGYAADAEGVRATVERAIRAGAVGVNLEDGGCAPGALVDVGVHAGKIAAARLAANEAGVPLVVNARTDVFWRSVGGERGRLAEAVRRALAYCGAGADCVFVPGAAREDDIATLAREIPRPLNLLAAPGMPGADRLEGLGVRRVTVGSALARTALGRLRAAAESLRAGEEFARVFEDAVEYGDLQRLLASRA